MSRIFFFLVFLGAIVAVALGISMVADLDGFMAMRLDATGIDAPSGDFHRDGRVWMGLLMCTVRS